MHFNHISISFHENNTTREISRALRLSNIVQFSWENLGFEVWTPFSLVERKIKAVLNYSSKESRTWICLPGRWSQSERDHGLEPISQRWQPIHRDVQEIRSPQLFWARYIAHIATLRRFPFWNFLNLIHRESERSLWRSKGKHFLCGNC